MTFIATLLFPVPACTDPLLDACHILLDLAWFTCLLWSNASHSQNSSQRSLHELPLGIRMCLTERMLKLQSHSQFLTRLCANCFFTDHVLAITPILHGLWLFRKCSFSHIRRSNAAFGVVVIAYIIVCQAGLHTAQEVNFRMYATKIWHKLTLPCSPNKCQRIRKQSSSRLFNFITTLKSS